MPRLHTIRAYRYAQRMDDPQRAPLTSRLAPPYDRVDDALRRHLLAQDPDNIVGVDVPNLPVTAPGSAEVYGDARGRLDDLLKRGVLARDEEPGFFVVRQTYAEGSGPIHRRTALLARLRIDPAPDGSSGAAGIFPHEEIRTASQQDRLALLTACAMQSSPILAMYAQNSGAVEDIARLTMLENQPRQAGVCPEGILHELWPVGEPTRIEAIRNAFGDRPVVIADGHSRFAAACAYVDSLGPLAQDHPARHCLFALMSHRDPGLTIRPVHRVLFGMPDYSLERFIAESRGLFELSPQTCGPEALPERISAARYEGTHAIGLYDFATDSCHIASTEIIDPLAQLLPDEAAVLRRLDPVVSEHLIIDQVLTRRLNNGRPPQRKPATVISSFRHMAADPSLNPQLAIVLSPVTTDEIIASATSGHPLPPDSTYIWPKFATGLVLNSLRPEP